MCTLKNALATWAGRRLEVSHAYSNVAAYHVDEHMCAYPNRVVIHLHERVLAIIAPLGYLSFEVGTF